VPVAYPYVTSPGALSKTIAHLRKSFPSVVNVKTLQKLGLAPKNESYIINTLRFLQVIDEEGKKSAEKAACFNEHKDEAFQEGFAKIVESSFRELFELHGAGTWALDDDTLISFFRTSAQSSETVGRLQARTFTLLAEVSGRAKPRAENGPDANRSSPVRKRASQRRRPPAGAQLATIAQAALERPPHASSASQVGLTVLIEINLPAEGDQDTYDRIFRSIRENLIHGT